MSLYRRWFLLLFSQFFIYLAWDIVQFGWWLSSPRCNILWKVTCYCITNYAKGLTFPRVSICHYVFSKQNTVNLVTYINFSVFLNISWRYKSLPFWFPQDLQSLIVNESMNILPSKHINSLLKIQQTKRPGSMYISLNSIHLKHTDTSLQDFLYINYGLKHFCDAAVSFFETKFQSLKYSLFQTNCCFSLLSLNNDVKYS